MTKAKRQEINTRIAEFDGTTGLIDYYSWPELEKVVSKIVDLGYTYVMTHMKGQNPTTSFIELAPPFNVISIYKETKVRLDSVYLLVDKFITEYKPKEDEVKS